MEVSRFISLLLFSFIISLALSSCADQVLSTEPGATFTENDVWNDINLVEKYVYDNYRGLGWWGIQDNGRGMYASATDEAYDFFNLGEWVINQGVISPDNMGAFNRWEDHYKFIRNVNIFFDNIDDVPLENQAEEERAERLKGEMKYIRANSYHELLKLYGGVPIITEVFELSDDFGRTRDSYEDVVGFIVSELDEAKEMVPETVSSDNWGRVTKAAVQALKSEVLLYAASKLHDPSTEPSGPLFDYTVSSKWQDASDAAKEIIDMDRFALFPVETWRDYTDLFLIPNDEIIFARVNHSEYGNPNQTIEQMHLPNGYGGWSGDCPLQNLVDDYEMDNGAKINEEASGYDPDNPYENRDPRFYATIVFQGTELKGRETEFYLPGGLDSRDGPEAWNYAQTGYTMRKFVDEDIDFKSTFSERPYIFFRLAEIYLNYAEAQYHLGNEGVAREYVNKIRRRVNMPEINSSGHDLLDDIRHERRIELVFEAHRFFDVRRWMIANETGNIEAKGIEWRKLDENGELSPDGSLEYNIITVQEREFDDRMYYMPIPMEEVNRSGIQQNPGY